MKARLLKQWREKIRLLVGRAMADADRLQLRGPAREKFVRRIPPEVKRSRWLVPIWHSELRAIFGREREPPHAVPRRRRA